MKDLRRSFPSVTKLLKRKGNLSQTHSSLVYKLWDNVILVEILFSFVLRLVVMYETKENKAYTKDKNEPKINLIQ